MASKLYVGNLPHSTTDAGLTEFVTNAGYQVASALVIRDKMTGQPRGFGFVELAEGQDLPRPAAGNRQLEWSGPRGPHLDRQRGSPPAHGLLGPAPRR